VLDAMGSSTLRALCYAAIGLGLAIWRMQRRDA
jgi:ABC-2 type transport system permease protein